MFINVTEIIYQNGNSGIMYKISIYVPKKFSYFTVSHTIVLFDGYIVKMLVMLDVYCLYYFMVIIEYFLHIIIRALYSFSYNIIMDDFIFILC